jgi:CRP-like cAMP-binding protein
VQHGDTDLGLSAETSTQLDTLASLYQSGNERHVKRDAQIYPEESRSTHWYQVVSGAVRLVIFFADGQRHIENFKFAGECFGFETPYRSAAEAMTDCVIYRYPRRTIRQLIQEFPQLAQQLWNMNLQELAHAQRRTILLGKMSPPMRIASFLLELSARCGSVPLIDLPISRSDMADYLGLTIETVSRILSGFSNLQLIAMPSVNQIEIIDAYALETITIEGLAPGPVLGHYYGTRRARGASRSSPDRRTNCAAKSITACP